MTLRARLALAFFLLAVVPLSGMSLYTYGASRGVLRRAAEAEARALADRMDARADTAVALLSRRMAGLRSRPRFTRTGAFAEARAQALAEAEHKEIGQSVSAILAEVPREQGDIPFAMDDTGKLLAADDADRPVLERLDLTTLLARAAGGESRDTVEDWVVVTRRDAQSGYRLGIARPLGGALGEMRQLAVRNLLSGLALTAVALLGILPLSRRMTRELSELEEGASRLAAGDASARVSVRGGDEFARLASAFNRMADQLASQRERLVHQERLQKELELGRRIQAELLPRHPLRLGGMEVSGLSIPAREVGGDFFNYFPLPDGAAVVMGDVSGKGIAAALLMANVQATLRARLPREPDLAALAADLDAEIHAQTPDAYVTLVLGRLEVATGRFRYVNAGHNPPFAVRADGAWEPLGATGRPLGLLPGGGYDEHALHLRSGDRLFLYTDGLAEAEDAGGISFVDHLPALLADAASADILARLAGALRAHCGGRDAEDDATMLLLSLED